MSNGTVEQNTSSHSGVNLSDLKISSFASLNSFLIDELEVNLSINLSDDLKNIIKTYLSEYESLNQRKLEEKDLIISQLKQSLLDLTEKRFRAAVQNGSSSLPYENIEFLINEKESKINQLLDQLSENERDINKLKQTIKSQDDVILSLNNNIYELKNNNQTVLKAKQESFKLMNEDLSSKQKLIDDQSETIQDLSEKTRRLENELEKAHKDLEKRLNEKQTDLQIKIAQFEANLREGKIYFEDVLAEKTNEINRLKQKLENLGQVGDDEAFNSEESNQVTANKFDSDNIKNIKALYEHQIDILKVKIEMLEKTCSNYQQGIKEMNKNFGIKQLSDEVNSIQTFKDLMQDLQKTNVNLETEKIDLQVNNSKLQSQLEQTRTEKENLNKKFQAVDQLNQRLSQEKLDQETHYQSLLDSKEAQLSETSQRLELLSTEFDQLSQENLRLGQISLEYDQLKIANQELAGHYEQLCQQATDIVNGNQMLNDQVESNHVQIEQLKSQVNDLNLQIDHLTNCNSELNTQKVNYEVKVEDLEQKIQEIQPELDELEALRRLKLDTESLNEQLKDLKIEIEDKNELIDQLNQAKEFLAENNSKLLTNNIKIQLFVESLGLDQSEIENSQRVKEYDDLVDKLSKYESEILDLRIKLEELNCPNEKIGLHKETQFDNLSQEIDELKTRLANNEKMTLKLKAKLKQMLKKSTICQENEAQTEDDDRIQHWLSIGAKMAEEKIEKEVKESLNALKYDVECLLLSRALKSDKSLNTSQDFDYRDQIFNLEAQLNDKLNQITELKTKCEHKNKTNDSLEDFNQLRIKIEQLQQEIRIKDEQIDALSDWNSKALPSDQFRNEKETLEFQIKQLNEENEDLREEKQMFENKIKELEGEIKIKDEQIDALSDWGSSVPVNEESKLETEALEIKIKQLNEEIEVLRKENEENSSEEFENKNEDTNKLVKILELRVNDLENDIKIKNEQIVALSDWNLGVTTKTDMENNNLSQFEDLKDKIKCLNDENEFFKMENKRLEMLIVEQVDVEEFKSKIKELESEIRIKDEQIDALSDWGSSMTGNEVTEKEKISHVETLEEKIKCLNEENESFRMEKQRLEILIADKIKVEVFENKIKELEGEIKIKDEQIDALSDWGSSVPVNEESKRETEALKLKLKQLNEEIEVLREENRKILLDHEKNQNDLNQELENAKEIKQRHILITDELENKINAKDEEIFGLREHFDSKINCLNEENQNLVSNLNTEKNNLIDQVKNLNETNEKYLFTIGEYEIKIKQLENEVKIKEEQIEAVSDWSNVAQNKSENEDQVESLKHQILDLQVELKAKLELVDALELKLKTTDQELDTIKCSYKHLEDQLSQINFQEKETKIESVQLLGNSATNDESIELKARINQIMIELSIKNEQLTSLENFLNEQKLESQKLGEKLSFECENWKKKYESMRLKALALRDKCKKLELSQCLEDGRASPSNSSKSSMDSSSLAEHLFHNLQAEYKEFKKSHEDQINDLNNQLLGFQNEFNQYKIEYNEDKIRTYELSIESLEKEKNSLNLNIEQLNEKYSHIEKQNLKLKAKLKQIMAKKDKEEIIDVQKTTTVDMQTQTCIDFVSEISQTNIVTMASASSQTDDNEIEILRIQNEQYKCRIEVLEKNQLTDETKSELDELKEKIKTVQEQNLKLKAKLKQLMGLNQKIKADFECQTNLETMEKNECDNLLKKIANIEEALENKEKINNELRIELNEVKESIEKQRIEHENQINALNQELVDKESNLVQIKEELSGLRSQSEVSMMSCMPNGLMSESLVLDETASTCSSNLENQLKFCHEKCEKVVAKLSLLRKQNESLNSKIRTIKSMIAS